MLVSEQVPSVLFFASCAIVLNIFIESFLINTGIIHNAYCKSLASNLLISDNGHIIILILILILLYLFIILAQILGITIALQ